MPVVSPASGELESRGCVSKANCGAAKSVNLLACDMAVVMSPSCVVHRVWSNLAAAWLSLWRPMWSAVRRAELCFSAAAMVMVMRQANTSSSYGGLRLATQATKELPKASTPPPAPTPLPDAPLFKAKKLEDWLGPESFQYKGLLVSREPTWKDCQDVVDRVANRGEFGEDDDIKVKGVSAKEDLVAVADKLLVKVKLPEDVCEAIRRDVLEVGATVRSLCPWSDGLDFKLEIIGENSCTRWHRDNYCARAIVTYNSGGTTRPQP